MHLTAWRSFILAALTSACLSAAQDTIPIYACVSIPGGAFSTPERYRELADAGFTTSLTGFGSLAQALAALDAAKGSGVSVFVQCPELTSDIPTAVAKLSAHPAFAGYHLTDEPSAAAFADLGAWTKKIQALDTAHPCYINLLPTYASPAQLGTATYQEHIDRFLSAVPVPLLSFDNYPTQLGVVQTEVFTNLEIVAAAARRVGKPFWGFYQATLFAPKQPPRTLAGLRFESFINLAYGAQCIQAYTYWETFADDRVAPIDKAGNRTAAYALVKSINAEIRAWSRVFLGAQVLAVAHAGMHLAPGTKPFTAPFAANSGLNRLDVGTGSALVSFLKNGTKNFIALVNTDIQNPLKLTLGFDDPRRMTELRKDGQDRQVTSTEFTIDPGGLLVFQVR